MQGISFHLHQLMAERGLSQEELAKVAGVSQSTVSRALNRTIRRRGAAYIRLCIYAGVVPPGDFPGLAQAHETVLASFERIWDRTDSHAAAIAQVIDSLAALKPSPQPSPPIKRNVSRAKSKAAP